MSFEAERQALEVRFSTNWVETPIKWGNIAFKTAGVAEYVAISLIHNDAMMAMRGSVKNLYRYDAFIVTQIFVKAAAGSRRAHVLADMINDIWRTFSYNFITIHTPEIIEVGINRGWYQLTIIHPYYRNEYKAASSA
jgi:hypothetical protein